jgi:alkanesulfonate monooxygenase SsuD/methylene tetrahydromethanopterin reductase-like flavin-dependent oxidoreductase (luciferase family)
VLRCLWNNGRFSGENSLDNFPYLYIKTPPQHAPPMLLGAMGPKMLAIGPARLLTYVQMQGYGEILCKLNGWDPAVMSELRNHPLFEGGKTAEHCAKRLNNQFDAGADGVLIHGSLPRQVESLLAASRKVRRKDYFDKHDPWFTPSLPGTGF